MDATFWINLLTPVLGPILTAMAKKVWPLMPKWLTPILAIVLGALSNIGGSAAFGVPIELGTAAALGVAGIGVREVTKHFNPLTRKTA